MIAVFDVVLPGHWLRIFHKVDPRNCSGEQLVALH